MIRPDSQIDFSNPYILEIPPNKDKKTTIIATLSDTTITPVDIQKMLEAGLNVVKFRLSHTTQGDKMRMLSKVDRASVTCCQKYGVTTWPIATCIDLKTCIVKTGLLPDRVKSVNIKEGSYVTLTSNVKEYDTCNEHRIFVDNACLTCEVVVGTEISIRQEEIVLHCTEIINEKEIKCIVTKGGELFDLNSVSMRGIKRKRSTLGKIDYETIKFALEYQVDMLIINYVHHADMLRKIKKFIGHKVRRPFLISGICTQQALDNIDDIAKESDAIMLAREFLPFELEASKKLRLSRIQKWLGAKCQTLGRPYFISGDVFQDILTSGEFSDREVSDVTNALFDGASGFILRDCPNIEFLLEAITSMNDLCRSVEPYTDTNSSQVFWRVIDEVPLNAAEACMLACVSAANQSKAPVIVIPTVTGATARALLRMSPACFILTVSTKTRVTRLLNTCKCVVPLMYVGTQRKKWSHIVEAKVHFAIEYAVRRGWLVYGDSYVTLERGSAHSSYCDTVRVWNVTNSKKALVECLDDEEKEEAENG